MNGYETREQRQAHVRALVNEQQDIKRSLRDENERLKRTSSEADPVAHARVEARIIGLRQKLDAVNDQLEIFAGQSRTPRERAETRGPERVSEPAQAEQREPKRKPKAAPERRA